MARGDADATAAATASFASVLAYPVATAALMVNGLLVFLQIFAVGVIDFGGQLPRLFGAPLAGTIGMLALSVIGYLVHVVIWISLYRYGFEILFLSANGRRQPPEVVGLVDGEVANRHVWLQIALIFACVIVARRVGMPLGVAAALALGALMPAAAIALTVTQSLAAAINPAQWLRAIGALGVRYAPLMAAGMVMVCVTTFAVDWTPASKPYVLGVVIYYATAHLLVMLGFHVIGLGLHTVAGKLDFRVDGHALPAHRLRVDEDPILRRAELLARGNDLKAAAAHLQDALRHGGGIALHHRYREYLVKLNDRKRLREHARTFITQLRATEGDKPALKLLTDCAREDASFLPAETEDAIALIATALQRGDNALALSQLDNLRARAPRRADVRACALRVADGLIARRQRLDDAARLIDDLTLAIRDKPSPNDPTIEQIEAVAEKLRVV